MARNILPFRVSQQDPKTPLSPVPYRSRKAIHSFNQGTEEKNYKYVAFRPGYAVQASELNEIQENWHMDNTLFSYMINAWGFYCGKPYDGSGDEDTGLRYGGPGWDGATPLVPYGSGDLPDPNVVPPVSLPDSSDIPELVSVTQTATNITIQFNQGYYLTSVRTGTEVDNGFKYFVYLNYVGGLGESVFTTTIPKSAGGITYVGLLMTQSYVAPPGEETSDPDGLNSAVGDSTLYDNSAGFYNRAATGAKRVKFEFTGAASAGTNGSVQPTQISPVLYANFNTGKIRYMNNVIVEDIT
jgi:hypothetical protein